MDLCVTQFGKSAGSIIVAEDTNASGTRGAIVPESNISSTLKQVMIDEGDDELKSILLEYLSKPTSPKIPAVTPTRSKGALAGSGRRSNAPDAGRNSYPALGWSELEAEEPETGVFHAEELTAPPCFVRDRAVMVRVDGPTGGEVTSVANDDIVIGRSAKAHLHLTDSGVSRKHARIFSEEGAPTIEDLGSSNGTFVGGRPITRSRLKDGDLVRFGPNATFRYSLMDAQQEAVLKRLYESSIYDPLTGVFNRRHFEERLEAEVAYSVRHKAPVSLVLLDIDFFKSINDNYGHPAGDRVLREIGRVAQQQLRTEDVFARYGGEEFAVLLRGVGIEGAARAANRMRISIAEHAIDIGGMRIAVTVSAGCATLDALEFPSPGTLIERADERLYQAKRTGRNRVVLADD